MLYGSNIFPPTVFIGEKEVQLGDIVRRAFSNSGLTVPEWNEMPEIRREYKLVDAFYAMRAEAQLRENE